jgi:hypothetical protein
MAVCVSHENLAREMSFTIEKEAVVYIVFNFGLIEDENNRFSTFEVNTEAFIVGKNDSLTWMLSYLWSTF